MSSADFIFLCEILLNASVGNRVIYCPKTVEKAGELKGINKKKD